MARAIFLALISASVAGACATLWSSTSRTALAGDMREVLVRGNVDPAFLDCHMLETTRSGICLFDASETEIENLTIALELRALELPNETELPSGSLAGEAQAGCMTSDPFVDGTDFLLYGIAGRPDQLELSSGGQFEYLILLFDPSNGEACVQASYSYG